MANYFFAIYRSVFGVEFVFVSQKKRASSLDDNHYRCEDCYIKFFKVKLGLLEKKTWSVKI